MSQMKEVFLHEVERAIKMLENGILPVKTQATQELSKSSLFARFDFRSSALHLRGGPFRSFAFIREYGIDDQRG
jgi:hypothetical protein